MKLPTMGSFLTTRGTIKLLTTLLIALGLAVLAYLFLIIPSIEKDILQEKKNQTEELLDLGLSVLNYYYAQERDGLLSRNAAQIEAIDVMRTLRYGPADSDYFWINDYSNLMILHPLRPDLEGRQLRPSENADDLKLYELFNRFISLAENEGRGHITYSWQYYDQIDRQEEKLSYIAHFEPWDWIIGTGVYLVDLERLISSRSEKAIILLTLIIAASAIGIYFFFRIRETEEELFASEEKYRLIAENTADNITILDLDLRYVYVSPSIYKLRGYTAEEAINQTLQDTLTPSSLQKAMETFQQIMAEIAEGRRDYDTVIRLELEEYHKNGSIIWVENSISFMKNSRGEPVGILTVAKDITDLKKVEEQLRQLNLDLEKRVEERTGGLERANRELAAFTYSVSHDLRAPLRTIIGYSEAMIEDYGDELAAGSRRYLDRIISAGWRMSDLIDNLLKLSRITRQEIHYDRVNLSDLVQHQLNSLQEREPRSELSIIIDEDCFARGDTALLRIAIDNLVENAWKYTESVDSPRLEFGITGIDGEKVFYLSDNGIGFPMKYAEKIFDPFQRLHNSKRYPGDGIGLSIVQRIIERHGGEIWATGEEGKGATFFFSLPE